MPTEEDLYKTKYWEVLKIVWGILKKGNSKRLDSDKNKQARQKEMERF